MRGMFYLGRLLAVYDLMEQRAMFERDENGKVKEGRTTNAKRYWNAFSSRPAKTFKTIKQNMIPYERKLTGFQLKKFEEWTEEIMVHLAGQDLIINRCLKCIFRHIICRQST